MPAAASAESRLVDELTGLARAYAEAQGFISLLAHELRTRLELTERALSADGMEGVRAALASIRALQELVEDLLELARGRPDERADAGEAMRWVRRDLGADVDAEIVVRDLPVVALPQALLSTVLRNLVVNALEAGASEVEVFARPDRTICVRDDGPGVPPANASKIFGLYSSKFGGSGLALALCREILRRRSGDLWLELPSTFCLRV